ncbi:UDP-N-acetylmuramoyl-L-alanyl-D-glutamate--2,6-diaminopimelate ligase [Candidatus Microgenomates bacterium]|nr:UDP-N-acetylmuramoyl-L-alanyl-D-glutamate--2,6-diaminopimelate ligase [Candidatus Microgenomates bacterium]
MVTKQSLPFRTTIRPFLKTQIKKYLPLEAINYLYHFPVALMGVLFHFYPARNLTVIGVTGTSGKTTVVSIIYHLLKKAGLAVSMVSTIQAIIGDKEYDTGFHVTNPDPWQLQKYFQQAVKAGSKYFVLEITSHGLAQFRNIGAHIDLGIVTNVTHEHLDYHKTFKNYLLTKAKIFSGVKYSIINRDDKNFRLLKNLSSGRVVSFGIKNDADYTPAKYPFVTNLTGEFNKYNCLAAICAAKILGLSDELIKKSLVNIPALPGRMEEVKLGQNFRIFIDFAHKPDALEKVLQTSLKKPHKRIIVMFGVAGLRDKAKRPIMGEIATRLADISVFTAEDPRTENLGSLINQIVQGARRTNSKEISERELVSINKKLPIQHLFLRVPDRKKAINLLINKIAQKGDIILFCGKGHEKSMCFGTTEFPWDEKKEIVDSLKDNAKK